MLMSSSDGREEEEELSLKIFPKDSVYISQSGGEYYCDLLLDYRSSESKFVEASEVFERQRSVNSTSVLLADSSAEVATTLVRLIRRCLSCRMKSSFDLHMAMKDLASFLRFEFLLLRISI